MYPEKNGQHAGPEYLIVPAAGLGTRMKEVNPDLPKELLPVGNKPAIQYTIEEGIAAGVNNIIIIINKHKDIIRQYFEDPGITKKLYPLSCEEILKINDACSIIFRYQERLLGESDAVSHARDIAEGHTVAVIYPDNLYLPARGALNALKSAFSQYGTDVIALNEVPDDICRTISNAGRVDTTHLNGDIYRVDKFLPKGKGHFYTRFTGELRACGIYISGPHIFDYIERSREKVIEGEFTDIYVRNIVLEEKGMIGCNLPGIVYDIGNPEGYEYCVERLKE